MLQHNRSKHFAHFTPFADRVIKINLHYSKEQWNSWISEVVIFVRQKQAELMTLIDYHGLREAASLFNNRFMDENMPMIWPLDEETFEYANNKAAKNSTKPGDILVCPTLSGPPAIVEVISRKGKQQTLKLLSGPDKSMIDHHFKWHADHNNLFFRVIQKRQLKKLIKETRPDGTILS